MSGPYDTAIAGVRDEIANLEKTLRTLERYAESTETVTADKPTNEQAIRAILEAAYPQHLSYAKIVELGPSIGGRRLNKDSVRWVLARGVKWGQIEKVRNGARMFYRRTAA